MFEALGNTSPLNFYVNLVFAGILAAGSYIRVVSTLHIDELDPRSSIIYSFPAYAV
jgi:hypothetical protein